MGSRMTRRMLDPLRRPRGLAPPLALACALVAGCAEGPEPPPIPDADLTPADEVSGAFGLINVIEAGARAEVHAVFAEQLPASGVIDGLAWLGAGDPGNGYWVQPEFLGELLPVAELAADLQWTDDRYLDVGEELTVAGVAASRVTEWQDPDGFHTANLVFYRDDGDVTADQLGTITTIGFSWPGGEDVDAENRPGAVTRVEPMELASHDPAVEHLWFEGTDLDLSWIGAVDGEVLVTLLGDLSWHQVRLEGGETANLPAATLAEAVSDRFEVRIARVAVAAVEAGPGQVVYRFHREQRLQFVRSGVLTVEPDVLRLGEVTQLTVAHHDGTFVQDETSFELGAGVVVDEVDVPDGEGTTALLAVTVLETAETGAHDITATTADETVVSERMLTVLLPPAETCEEAFLLPGDGLYHGRLAGGVDDYTAPDACPGNLAAGPDQVFAVELTDTQILSATLYHQGADVVLYLAADCASIESPLTCSDVGGVDVAEFVSFVPDVGDGGTFYLVVDAYDDIAPEADSGYSLSVSTYEF